MSDSRSLFAPIYESLEKIEAEARMHENALRYTAPYWWQGRPNHAAIQRSTAAHLQRQVRVLEREMEKVRER